MNRLKVIIIEDDNARRTQAFNILRQAGAEVRCLDWEGALNMLLTEEVNVVISAINLPSTHYRTCLELKDRTVHGVFGIDGNYAIKYIAEHFGGIRTILLLPNCSHGAIQQIHDCNSEILCYPLIPEDAEMILTPPKMGARDEWVDDFSIGSEVNLLNDLPAFSC